MKKYICFFAFMFFALATQAQFNHEYLVKLTSLETGKVNTVSCQLAFDAKGTVKGTWFISNKKLPLQGNCVYRTFKVNNKETGNYIMDIYLNDLKGKHLAHITAVDERGDRRKFKGEYITTTDVESDIEMTAK